MVDMYSVCVVSFNMMRGGCKIEIVAQFAQMVISTVHRLIHYPLDNSINNFYSSYHLVLIYLEESAIQPVKNFFVCICACSPSLEGTYRRRSGRESVMRNNRSTVKLVSDLPVWLL